MTASRPTESTAPEPGRPADPASVSPFEPEGVEFRPVSPKLVTARLTLNLGFDAVVIIVFLVLGAMHSHWWFLGAGATTATTLWEAWLIPRQVRAMGYALGEDHLLWRKGIMFRHLSVVPYGRMQFVDTSQGPLARHLGIAEVKLHTASASTDATINGLPVAEAEHLRQLLSERGEERMSGL